MERNNVTAVVLGILATISDSPLNAATATPMLAMTSGGVLKWLIILVVCGVWLRKKLANPPAGTKHTRAWVPPAQPSGSAADRQPSVGRNDAQGRIGPGADAGKVVTVDEVQQVLRSAAVRPEASRNNPG